MKKLTEKGFMATVTQFAKIKGWSVYHTHDSRRSEPGFPDLFLIRDTRIVYAELKLETGKLSEAQLWWIAVLRKAGQEVAVWRPMDWTEIEKILS